MRMTSFGEFLKKESELDRYFIDTKTQCVSIHALGEQFLKEYNDWVIEIDRLRFEKQRVQMNVAQHIAGECYRKAIYCLGEIEVKKRLEAMK